MTASAVRREPFGRLPNGREVERFTLVNARGTTLRVLSLGGIIQSLETRDAEGRMADITLGYDALDQYLADQRYLGALIGRYANRIARGRFVLDGVEHRVPTNDGPNHLHGGPRGFHTALWRVAPFALPGVTGLELRHESPDGDSGYPGALSALVTYSLGDDDALTLDFHAVADRATPISLTQHAYWNLGGHDAGSIAEHEISIAASRFTPVDSTMIPTGELRAVEGTAFDFRAPVAIGSRLDPSSIERDEQLRLAGGIDHNLALDGTRALGEPPFAARLRDPRSGRVLEIYTREPGLQFYSGNKLAGGPPGKGAHEYAMHGGLALESQRFPDSPNHPEFPPAIVRPGEVWTSRTVWRFGISRDGHR